VQYVADPTHGFRVAATNLPVEAPDVAQAREAHLAEFEAIKAERAKVVPYFNPVSVSLGDVPQLPNQQVFIQLFVSTRFNTQFSSFQNRSLIYQKWLKHELSTLLSLTQLTETLKLLNSVMGYRNLS